MKFPNVLRCALAVAMLTAVPVADAGPLANLFGRMAQNAQARQQTRQAGRQAARAARAMTAATYNNYKSYRSAGSPDGTAGSWQMECRGGVCMPVWVQSGVYRDGSPPGSYRTDVVYGVDAPRGSSGGGPSYMAAPAASSTASTGGVGATTPVVETPVVQQSSGQPDVKGRCGCEGCDDPDCPCPCNRIDDSFDGYGATAPTFSVQLAKAPTFATGPDAIATAPTFAYTPPSPAVGAIAAL